MEEPDRSGSAIEVQIARVRESCDLPLPEYQSAGAAGMDIMACLEEPVTIGPGETARIPSGFAIAVPEGFEAQVRPRSGLAFRNAISLPNSPGTIDSDYRGEVQIILINHGNEPFRVEHGLRIAQMVITHVSRIAFQEVPGLPSTSRGAGGFGSTGQ